jgi:hypothetical protein
MEMTQTLAKDVVLDRVGSHSVSTGYNYRDEIEKEECFGYFSATWRGQPVRLTMNADRYRHSSGMSEWRVYCRDAKVIEPDDDRNGDWYYHGASVSDTARQRLGEVCQPMMAEWLESDGYVTSRRLAFVRMLKRLASDLAKYNSGSELTRMLDKYRFEISADQFAQLTRAGIAFAAYCDALAEIDA